MKEISRSLPQARPRVAAPHGHCKTHSCRKSRLWPLVAAVTLSAVAPHAAAEDLLSAGSTWRFFKGRREASSPLGAWRERGFDDSSWSSGSAPFRYGDGEGGTELTDMQGGYTTLFLRRSFELSDPDSADTLHFSVDYDDGFVAWVNGVEVLRVNSPDDATHDGTAPVSHEAAGWEEFEIDDLGGVLVGGVNVLAVQVFNLDITSSDLFFDLHVSASLSVGDTTFSVDRGFFDEPFSVEITTTTPDAEIRYTTDSSWPSPTRGTRYTGPIEIESTTVLRAIAFKDGLEPTNVDTHTYLFLDDILEQEEPDDYPSQWPSAKHRNDTADYAMDPDVVDDSRYRDDLIDGMLELPAVSLVMDPDEMFGDDGVYHNGDPRDNNNDLWERAASLELIYPNGAKGFQLNCGIRPHSHVSKKRSFKVIFKREYGPAKLRFPLLESATEHSETGAEKFDRLVLRAGFNRSWSQAWNLGDTCFTRDQWVRNSQIAMSGAGSRGIYVHLYINGLYWGLYNPSERPDAWFTSTYFGGEKEEWFAVNHGGDISGDPRHYRRIAALATERQLDKSSKYDEISKLVDLAHYSDYLLLNWYAGTGDWPSNNWYGGLRADQSQPLRHFVWDAEDCFDDLGSEIENRSNDGAWIHPAFRKDATNGVIERSVNSELWRALRENEDFMMVFADRVHRQCFNDGPLSEDRAVERWLELNDTIENAIVGESARWGDAVASRTRTRDRDWTPEVDRIAEESLVDNVERFIDLLQDEGYYPDVVPPGFNTDNHVVPAGFELRLTNPQGSPGDVYVTYDGSDPRKRGGEVSSSAERFSSAVRITRAMHVKARVLLDSEWSPLTERVFYIAQDFDALRFTEIMYNPPNVEDVDDDLFEFIELKNSGTSTLDLSGLHFVDGIEFAFPLGARLVPGEIAVLVADQDEFRLRYPGIPVAGVYERNLSNGGETVSLATPVRDTVVTAVTYDDAAPWPVDADGDGYSLVSLDINPSGAQNHPALWQRSFQVGGSPGLDDPAAGEPPDGDVPFIRGDSNGDGRADISDSITTLSAVLLGGTLLLCPDAADVNDDGDVDLSDPIFSVNFFFIGGNLPPPPYPEPGLDPTPDTLGACR